MSSASFVCLFLIGFVCKIQAYGEYIPKSIYSIDEDGSESEQILVRNKREVEDALSRFKRGGGAYSYSGSSSSSGGYDPSAELAQIQARVEDIVKQSANPSQIFSRFQDIGDSHPIGSGNGGGGAYSYSGSTGSGFGSGYSSGSGHSSDNSGSRGSSEHSGKGGSSGYSGNGGSSGHSSTGGYSGNEGSSGYSGKGGYSGNGGSSGHSGNGGYNDNEGSSGHSGNGGSSSGPSIFSRSGAEKGTGIKVSSAAQGPNAAFSSSSSSSDGQGNVKYNVKSGQY